MDAKQFLKEKGISNNDFMDSGVADLIETLLTEYAFKLQQPRIAKTFCGVKDGFCPFKGSNKNCLYNGSCVKKQVVE